MSKSYTSKSYFMRCKSLHSLPKFTSTITRFQVGNGLYVGVLLIIPVIMTIQNHRFEIFTLWDSWKHRPCDWHQTLIWVRRCDRLIGLLCEFSKQVNSFLSKGESLCKTERAKDTNPWSTICGRNIRNGNYQNARCQRAKDPYHDIKIHKKQGNIQSDK